MDTMEKLGDTAINLVGEIFGAIGGVIAFLGWGPIAGMAAAAAMSWGMFAMMQSLVQGVI